MNRSTLAARSRSVRRLFVGGLAAAAVLVSATIGAPAAHADTPKITPGIFTLSTAALGPGLRFESGDYHWLQMDEPNESASQAWKFEPAGGGYWFLRNQSTHLVLETDRGSHLFSSDLSGTAAQQWLFLATGDGYWRIQNRETGERISSIANSLQYTFAADNFSDHQKWQIVPAADPHLHDRVIEVDPDNYGRGSFPIPTPSQPSTTPQVDLAVVSISGPTSLQAGLSGTYTITIKNQGTKAASLDLAIVFAGKLDQTGQIVAGAGLACEVKRGDAGINASVICNGGSLAAGATTTVVVQGRGPAAGSGLLVVNVNPSRSLGESDVANNTKQLSVTIN